MLKLKVALDQQDQMVSDKCNVINDGEVVIIQGFPQDKIIAGCSVFIVGHIDMSGFIFSIF